jgi:hypothetical protein
VKCISLLLILLMLAIPVGAQQQKIPTFDVRHPMIVAFFPPVSDAELQRDPDTNEALSDFQEYAQRVREPLRQRGIEFHEVYANRFGIKRGKDVVVFTPGKVQVGYYIVAPSKKPRIEYGVNTDVGLLQVADEYFGRNKTQNRGPGFERRLF